MIGWALPTLILQEIGNGHAAHTETSIRVAGVEQGLSVVFSTDLIS